MTVSRPAGLQAGVEIRLEGQAHAVIAVTGTSVRLEDAAGEVSEIPLAVVLNDPGLEFVAGMRAPLAGADVVETVPAATLEQARWVGRAHSGGADRAAAGMRP